jgi:hypothetical protein
VLLKVCSCKSACKVGYLRLFAGCQVFQPKRECNNGYNRCLCVLFMYVGAPQVRQVGMERPVRLQ